MNLKFGDQKSIDAVAEATKALPITRMYVSFGTIVGKECRDCSYFTLNQSAGNVWLCAIYRRTHNAKSWDGDSQACGKFEAKWFRYPND